LFLTGGYHFGFLYSLGQSIVLYLFIYFWTVLILLMGVYYFSYYLPDFAIAICLGCIFCFLFLGIYFNPI